MKKDGFSQVVSWCRFEWSMHANVVMLRLLASRSSPPWPLKIPPPPEQAEMKLLHLYNGSADLGNLFLSDLLIIYSSFDFFSFSFFFPPLERKQCLSSHPFPKERGIVSLGWEYDWKQLKKLKNTYTEMAHLLEDKKTPLHLKTDSKIFNLRSWLLKNLLEKCNY